MALNQDWAAIKAVTFDLWETLIVEKNGWNKRRTNARCLNLSQALDEIGVRIPVDQLTFAFKKMTSWLASIWNLNKEVTHLDQILFIIKTASRGSITIKEEWMDRLSVAYISAFFEVPPYLNPDTRKLLQWLVDHKKLVGLICNTGVTPGVGLRKFLAKEGVATYFDLMMFSDEVGIRKPNPEIFRVIAKELKTKPREIVHVGDNLITDIWGAKNAGFKAIYLLTEVGRDRVAESDPASLVSISRKRDAMRKEQIVPDRIVSSLAMVAGAIEELDLSEGPH